MSDHDVAGFRDEIRSLRLQLQFTQLTLLCLVVSVVVSFLIYQKANRARLEGLEERVRESRHAEGSKSPTSLSLLSLSTEGLSVTSGKTPLVEANSYSEGGFYFGIHDDEGRTIAGFDTSSSHPHGRFQLYDQNHEVRLAAKVVSPGLILEACDRTGRPCMSLSLADSQRLTLRFYDLAGKTITKYVLQDSGQVERVDGE